MIGPRTTPKFPTKHPKEKKNANSKTSQKTHLLAFLKPQELIFNNKLATSSTSRACFFPRGHQDLIESRVHHTFQGFNLLVVDHRQVHSMTRCQELIGLGWSGGQTERFVLFGSTWEGLASARLEREVSTFFLTYDKHQTL